MNKFELSSSRLDEIENDCDDTAGLLIKSSTLKYFIEREVNLDREQRNSSKNKESTETDAQQTQPAIPVEAIWQVLANELSGKDANELIEKMERQAGA